MVFRESCVSCEAFDRGAARRTLSGRRADDSGALCEDVKAGDYWPKGLIKAREGEVFRLRRVTDAEGANEVLLEDREAPYFKWAAGEFERSQPAMWSSSRRESGRPGGRPSSASVTRRSSPSR